MQHMTLETADFSSFASDVEFEHVETLIFRVFQAACDGQLETPDFSSFPVCV